VNYSIREVIEAVANRVAATQEDGRWTAEAPVIRLSYESVEGARDRLQLHAVLSGHKKRSNPSIATLTAHHRPR